MDIAANLPSTLPATAHAHLVNVAANLQLVADMGYGDISLAVRDGEQLTVVADARPVTAVSAVAASRVGQALDPDEELEAYECLEACAPVEGDRRRATRGIGYVTRAYPVHAGGDTCAIVIRDLTMQVVESPGAMERAFMEIADELLTVLTHDAFVTATGDPFSTTRRAGDGIFRLDAAGQVAYASPNALNIMRIAGFDDTQATRTATALPGGETAVVPVLDAGGALATEIEAGEYVLDYRAIALAEGAVVLVSDVTERRRQEQEIKVKEATIREVHHRVKNNLQTVASLLRIQERRSDSDEAARALNEAVERISSMAVVHELLAGATDERVEFADVAETVVDMVRQGLVGPDSAVTVTVEGTTGEIEASQATSLALVVAELVHNAIEHGMAGRDEGLVTVSLRSLPEGLHLTVRDDGNGMPEDFSVHCSAHLGLEIVRTLVEDDLSGTLAFGGGRGTTVTVRVPADGEEA